MCLKCFNDLFSAKLLLLLLLLFPSRARICSTHYELCLSSGDINCTELKHPRRDHPRERKKQNSLNCGTNGVWILSVMWLLWEDYTRAMETALIFHYCSPEAPHRVLTISLFLSLALAREYQQDAQSVDTKLIAMALFVLSIIKLRLMPFTRLYAAHTQHSHTAHCAKWNFSCAARGYAYATTPNTSYNIILWLLCLVRMLMPEAHPQSHAAVTLIASTRMFLLKTLLLFVQHFQF